MGKSTSTREFIHRSGASYPQNDPGLTSDRGRIRVLTPSTGGRDVTVHSTIDAAALAEALAAGPAPVLLDVRWRLGGPPGIERFREGHLRGAQFVDLDRDLAGPPGA